MGANLRRRRLARALRTWREQAGLTADEAARELICGAGTISRMENGQSADPYRVKGLFELYGASPDVVAEMIGLAKDARRKPTAVRKPYEDFVPKRLVEYYELEDEAEALSLLEGECVPGLLETVDYARALIGAGELPEDVDRLMDIRLERQKRLTSENPLRLRLILGEAALLTQVGGAKILRAQLEYLLTLAKDAPNIDIRILPFKTGARPSLGRNFTILSFPEEQDPDVIFAESVTYFVLEDETNEVEKFRSNYNRLWQMALNERASAKLIAQAATEIT
jgi:transcriptional regulator with XRE-family HTH domain